MPDEKKNRPPDEDDWYDIDTLASANDCTGLIPTPPATEDEAESYAEMMNVPKVRNPHNNGLQKIRHQPNNDKKT